MLRLRRALATFVLTALAPANRAPHRSHPTGSGA
jgi:hypothetical protein